MIIKIVKFHFLFLLGHIKDHWDHRRNNHILPLFIGISFAFAILTSSFIQSYYHWIVFNPVSILCCVPQYPLKSPHTCLAHIVPLLLFTTPIILSSPYKLLNYSFVLILKFLLFVLCRSKRFPRYFLFENTQFFLIRLVVDGYGWN